MVITNNYLIISSNTCSQVARRPNLFSGTGWKLAVLEKSLTMIWASLKLVGKPPKPNSWPAFFHWNDNFKEYNWCSIKVILGFSSPAKEPEWQCPLWAETPWGPPPWLSLAIVSVYQGAHKKVLRLPRFQFSQFQKHPTIKITFELLF